MSTTLPGGEELHLTSDRRNSGGENLVKWVLRAAGLTSVLVSFGIVFALFEEAFQFIAGLPSLGLLWDARGWSPSGEVFDLRTLLVPTVLIAVMSMVVALPLGLGAAIYLAEYANPRVRRWVKPIMEVLAGIPSVVLGFFALTFITPNLVQVLIPSAQFFNMVSASIAVGVLASPYMASVSEDALRAVPQELREASFGLGARKRRTVTTVVLPAALSGLTAAVILTLSRVIGETMIVTIAGGVGGSSPLLLDPRGPGLTFPAAIANLALGSEAVTTGYQFQSIYFLGLVLFVMTLGLNVLGDRVVRKYRKAY